MLETENLHKIKLYIISFKTSFSHIEKDSSAFGKGNSASFFLSSLQKETLWELNKQKQFIDI